MGFALLFQRELLKVILFADFCAELLPEVPVANQAEPSAATVTPFLHENSLRGRQNLRTCCRSNTARRALSRVGTFHRCKETGVCNMASHIFPGSHLQGSRGRVVRSCACPIYKTVHVSVSIVVRVTQKDNPMAGRISITQFVLVVWNEDFCPYGHMRPL